MSNGRHIMFACRLSEREQRALESLLSLAYCDPEDKSGRFRSIILELEGRFSRNFIGHLVYHAPSYERPAAAPAALMSKPKEDIDINAIAWKLRQ